MYPSSDVICDYALLFFYAISTRNATGNKYYSNIFYLKTQVKRSLSISKVKFNNYFNTFKLLLNRLSDDVPSQSDSIPLFNVYFTGCMVFSLCSIIWFNQLNIYSTKKELSKVCRCFILQCICPILRISRYKILEVETVHKKKKQKGF